MKPAVDIQAAGRLAPILADVARRAEARRRLRPVHALRAEVRAEPSRRAAARAALSRPGVSVIAEVKRRSPSVGWLLEHEDAAARAGLYADAGADMVSVLTEQDHFAGSLDDLRAARAAGVPLLRKDFILDEGMLLESVEHGASAVLLLAVVLPPTRLAELVEQARALGLASLVEVHAAAEVPAALASAPDAIGVNARDLTTFEVDVSRVEALLPELGTDVLRVAESGLRDARSVGRVVAAGADAVLVGETLMRAEDPAATLRALRGAPS